MRASVGGMRAPGKVGYGARQHIEITHHCRREEGEVELDAVLLKLVSRMRCRDGVTGLLHCGDVLRVPADKTIGFAVDRRETCNRLLCAGPVSCVGIVEMVRGRPEAE